MSEKRELKHVVIVPDGNRRWAVARGLAASQGHVIALNYDKFLSIFEDCNKLGIKYMSAWGFSTENWKRSEAEKKVLFKIFSDLVDMMQRDAHKNKFRFRHFGRKDRLPKELVDKMAVLEEDTLEYDEFGFNLLLDYGGRDEILRAVNKVLKSGKNEISEEVFASYLDSAGLPDPDLIIRTGGEKRLSGLLPFQGTYAELYFMDLKFPDFGVEQLREAVDWYNGVDRRFGGDSK